MENYDRAKKILAGNLDRLHLLARALLEKESLDGEEIQRLVLLEGNVAGFQEKAAAVASEAPPGRGDCEKEPRTPEDRDDGKEAKLVIPPLGLKSQEEGG